MRQSSLYIFLVVFLGGTFCAYAEKIFFDDGSVLDARVAYRNRDYLGVELSGDVINFPVNSLTRITDDDGSPSLYDYKFLLSNAWDSAVSRDYAVSIKAYDDIITLFPEEREAYYMRAVLKQRMGDLNGALSDYKTYAATAAPNAQILAAMGAIYAKHSSFSEALNLFNKALELEPDNLDVLHNHAVVCTKLGREDAARISWEKVASLDQYNIDARESLEYLNSKKGSEEKL